MAKAFEVISKDEGKETIKVKVEFNGKTKTVDIKDYKDEAENFRAMCRELHTFEKELKITK